VVAARAGEQWAVEALFRRYAPMINGLALRLIGRDADVDDLVQDCFVEALKNLGRLREPDAVAGWLRAIVVNHASKLIRKRVLLGRLGLSREKFKVDPDLVASRNVPADVASELSAIYRVIERLPARLRVPLVLRRIEEFSLEEVARLTKTSLATTKRRIGEAEQRLAGVRR